MKKNDHQRIAMTAGSWGLSIGDVAMMGLLVIAIVRCLVGFSSQVVWRIGDGTELEVMTSFGATGTAVVDWLSIVVLMIALVDRVARGKSVHWVMVLLWVTGAGFVVYHGMGYAASMRVGMNWVGATAIGLAALHLADVSRRRRVLIVAMVALMVPLGLGAVNQVIFEYGANVEHYESHKAEVLAEHGIELGSIGQRKFEERLTQREAVGQFGLSNVLGSVLMGLVLVGGVLAGGVLVGKARGVMKVGVVLVMVLVVVLGVVGLWLTFSKGAILALVCASAAMVVGWMVARLSGWGVWWWRVVVFGAVGMVIVVVVVRGLIGVPDSIEGERSLLFRSMYWGAAARMVCEEPRAEVVGVGPGCFKERYLVCKNRLSPEDVSDPHNVFVSYISMLGIGGVAWSVLLCMWLWCAAGGMTGGVRDDETSDGDGEAHESDKRWYWVIGSVVGVGAFGIQYVMHFEMLMITTAVIWALSVAVFVVLVGVLPRIVIDGRFVSVGLLGGATGVLLHSQIEMGMVHAMSGTLMCVLLGVAGALGCERDMLRGVGRRWYGVVSIVVVGLVCCVMMIGVVRVYRAGSYFEMAKDARLKGDVAECLVWLRRAQEVDSTVAGTRAGVLMGVSIEKNKRGAVGERNMFIDEAMESLASAREAGHGLAGLWRTEVRVCEAAWELTGDEKWGDRAMGAAKEMLSVVPYDISSHWLAAESAWKLGRYELAGKWYGRVLELDDSLYLDVNARLSDERREQARKRRNNGEG